MKSSSSCMDRYGNYSFSMHQQTVPPSMTFLNHAPQKNGFGYSNANDWTGVPLIKSVNETSRHKKIYNSRSHGYEYDDGNITQMAKHAHGSPIVMSGRLYRKPLNAFGNENGNVRNQNAGNFKAQTSCDRETHITFDESSYHVNGTCLPRIIKPRKRRKKDRKPINSMQQQQQTVENASSINPFTFSPSSELMQNLNLTESNNNNNNSNNNENFKQPIQSCDNNLFFNNDFNPNVMLSVPAASSSSTSSSPISLSNSSLSSSATTSSCSCQLCDPKCKIWAFPLRRSFSDNSAVEMEMFEHLNSIDGGNCNARKKDVGVIGGNRSKTDGNITHVNKSSFSIMDLIEQQNLQNSILTDANRLRCESLSDSGDSGCDLLLNGLNISDDLISSTIKTVNETFSIDGLNTITQQLSNFHLMLDDTVSTDVSNTIFNDNEQISYLNANANNRTIENGRQHQASNLTSAFELEYILKKSSATTCEFGEFDDHQQKNHSELDKSFPMNLAPTYNNYELMSPMLVNKQNYNNLDVNNNSNSSSNNTTSLCVNLLNEDGYNNNGLNQRSSFQFDCFDVTWKGS